MCKNKVLSLSRIVGRFIPNIFRPISRLTVGQSEGCCPRESIGPGGNVSPVLLGLGADSRKDVTNHLVVGGGAQESIRAPIEGYHASGFHERCLSSLCMNTSGAVQQWLKQRLDVTALFHFVHLTNNTNPT